MGAWTPTCAVVAARHARRQHGIVTRAEYSSPAGGDGARHRLGHRGRRPRGAVPGGLPPGRRPGHVARTRAGRGPTRSNASARRRRSDDAPPPERCRRRGGRAPHLHGLPGHRPRARRSWSSAPRRVRCKDVEVAAPRGTHCPGRRREVDRIPVIGLAWTVVDLAATATPGPTDRTLLAHVLGTGRLPPGPAARGGAPHRRAPGSRPGRTRDPRHDRAPSTTCGRAPRGAWRTRAWRRGFPAPPPTAGSRRPPAPPTSSTSPGWTSASTWRSTVRITCCRSSDGGTGQRDREPPGRRVEGGAGAGRGGRRGRRRRVPNASGGRGDPVQSVTLRRSAHAQRGVERPRVDQSPAGQPAGWSVRTIWAPSSESWTSRTLSLSGSASSGAT